MAPKNGGATEAENAKAENKAKETVEKLKDTGIPEEGDLSEEDQELK